MMAWETIAIVAVGLSALLAAIMVMFSRLFGVPSLEQWAKAEMVFSISTLFLVLFLVVTVAAVEPFLKDLVVEMGTYNYAQATGTAVEVQAPDDANLLDYTVAYMTSMTSCMRTLFAFLMKLNFPLELTASFKIDAFMFDIVTGWAFKGPVQTIRNITNYITFTLFIYYLFMHVMRFVNATAMSVFLPLGIVLRQFPPTRGAGAFVIAFALGFYFVFPFAYLLAINVTPQTFACLPLPEFDIPSAAGLGDMSKAFELAAWTDAHQNEILGAIQGTGTYIAGFSLDQFNIIPDALEPAGGRLAGFSINLCCLPFIAMMLTMTFILSTMNLFGANLPEVGRGFVKLI
jgi:hypothetical protein